MASLMYTQRSSMHATSRTSHSISSSKNTRAVWPTSRICLVACLLLTVLYQLHPLHYPTEQLTCQEAAPPLHGTGIPRHAAATELARHLDIVWDLGACYRNTSKLQQWLPPSRCVPLECLSSTACGADVDFSISLLDDLLPSADDTRVGTLQRQQHASAHNTRNSKNFHTIRSSPANGCPNPTGGQVAPPAHSTPEVTFLLYISDDLLLMGVHSLIELYTTAAEVASAEYIILHDTRISHTSHVAESQSLSGDDPVAWLPLTLAIQRLHVHFGALIHVIRHAPSSHMRGYNALMMEGARLATGHTLCLLDGRTLVAHGWLAPLMSTLATHPHVDAVGPLMMRSSGMQVSAAGGIVWSDGSVSSFLEGLVANHNVTYSRPVDFVPVGAMLVRRKAFLSAGGLRQDMGQHQGKTEGVDVAAAYAHASLGLSLWRAGHQSFYQPLGVVTQVPHTPALQSAAAELAQQRSRRSGAAPDPRTPKQLFHETWGTSLETQHCDPRFVPQAVAARSRTGPRILWVDDIIPEPDRDSGSIRTAAILNMLVADAFDVTYQPSTPRSVDYMLATQWAGIDVLPAWSPEQWAQTMAGGCAFDLVVVARRAVYQKWATQLTSLCRHVPLIYDTVDIHFLREARDHLGSDVAIHAAGFSFAALSVSSVITYLDSLPADSPLAINQAAELDIIKRSSATLVVSSTEVDLLRHYAPQARVFVVSNIHTHSVSTPSSSLSLTGPDSTPTLQGLFCSQRNGLLFVGNLQHKPNQAAILYLIKDILPALLRKPDLNGIQLHIVGSNQLPWGLQTVVDGCRNVKFHGWMADDALELLYGQVKVVVAPLLSGAGVKGKVNQAMKYAVPVVATSIAVEGMHVTHGVECLVANSPQEIAEAIATLYQDCKLWERIAEAGARNVAQHFSTTTAHGALMQAMAAVGVHPKAAGQEAHRCS